MKLFEDEFPDSAQYLMELYRHAPKHLIILVDNSGWLRLHMCYFQGEQIYIQK